MDDLSNARPKTVLVVDDEDSIRYLVRRLLGNEHTVVEARDGEEGVASALSHKPDVILMDMMMPRKDGLTACAEIRANPETQAIPIIMVTATPHRLNAQFAGLLGANAYITKPFKPQDLVDAINSLWTQTPE